MAEQEKTIVIADDNLACLVVDDNKVNITMAESFLLNHNIKAQCALSGPEALKMIEEKDYDIIFMDHLMPEMDGIETTAAIRTWEKNAMSFAEGETQRNLRKQVPIIALSANTAKDVEKMFLQAGMNDFISKPIIADELNRILGKWLPAGKISNKSINQKAFDPLENRLLEELSQIKGLDVKAGMSNVGQNPKGYILALRQFSGNCDSYIEDLLKAMETGSWEDYLIKAHALKGVLAAFGAGRLSQWAANLEKASESGECSSHKICLEETAPFCDALSKFKNMLSTTSLFDSSESVKSEKPIGEEIFLREHIARLRKACMECSPEDIEKTMTALGDYDWGSEADSKLDKIRTLCSSYCFEEALEKLVLLSR